jgi:AraC-like DNA-binding protein/mannose-6-phosphate isomerase-like protein (cupin superfamily)
MCMNVPSASPKVPEFISNKVIDGKYYILDPDAQAKQNLSIICAGKETCSEAYHIDRRKFEFFAIEFVASGSCELTLNGKKNELPAGSFFIYGPNSPHKIRRIGDVPLVKYFVDFAGQEALSRMEEFDLGEGSQFYAGNRRWIQDIFEQLLECSELDRAEARRLGEQLLKLLFVRLSTDRQPFGSVQPHSNETFSRCFHYITENFLKINTINEVSAACSVNGVYVSRLFKRYTKETPYQMLTRLKVTYAANLILRENLSVKQVGAQVGFDDPYHFSRVFKRVNGLSPKRYATFIKRGSLPSHRAMSV